MDTENEAEFFHPAADRAHSRIRSTRVSEIADAGTPQEKPKAPGEENGFMWNLNTYWRFLERDGGTYIQCESLTLTRDVPFALAWIIRPIVTQMPKESLTFTLAKARAALAKRMTNLPMVRQNLNAVHHFEIPAHLRHEVLDQRQVIPIQLVRRRCRAAR